MRKILLSLVAAIFATTFFAADNSSVQASNSNDWSFLQIGFWFGLPTSTVNSNVYGLKTGQPISSGSGCVNGAEISWLAAATDNIKGIQSSWVYTQNKDIQGIQASLVCNINKDSLMGMQAGSVNVAGDLTGFQPGAVNVSKNMTGIQGAALTNVVQEKTTGAQFSIVNITKILDGFQAAALNSAEKVNGVQLGLINISNSGGIQFGVANYIKDGCIPFLPIVNFKW